MERQRNYREGEGLITVGGDRGSVSATREANSFVAKVFRSL